MALLNTLMKPNGIRPAIAGATVVVFLAAAYGVIFLWPDGGASSGDAGVSTEGGAVLEIVDAASSSAALSSSPSSSAVPKDKPSTAYPPQTNAVKTDVVSVKSSSGTPPSLSSPAPLVGGTARSVTTPGKTVPATGQETPEGRPAIQTVKPAETAPAEPSATTRFFKAVRREVWGLDVQIGMTLAQSGAWIHEPAKPAERPAAEMPSWLSSQNKKGSTPESEAAVERALHWLAEHQYPDGSWSFEHRLGPCQNRCDNPGILKDAAMGATGLAILAFVSHGNTHQDGPYSKQVTSGLAYLIRRMAADGGCADGGRMYSHAIAALALCETCRIYQETYGPMVPVKTRGPAGGSAAAGDSPIVPASNNDSKTPRQKRLEQTRNAAIWNAANKAIAYTVSCQDPRLGGWRYDRRPDSDISVTGWQTMCLDSALKQRIHVPPATYQGITRFLDLMQQMQGATYGYHPLEPQVTPTRSAVGLLCRMYTGWPQSNLALAKGVELLAIQGPSEDDMYYNYYATLVLHHWGAELWDKWNERIRDYLVHVQARGGHQDGSWYLPNNRIAHLAGGRHLDTCLGCLILEVYYRSKSVYGEQRSPGDTPQKGKPAKP